MRVPCEEKRLEGSFFADHYRRPVNTVRVRWLVPGTVPLPGSGPKDGPVNLLPSDEYECFGGVESRKQR